MEAKKQFRIPRVIHYFWFGKDEKPGVVEKCIQSWREKCPDFEIKEWNESNYDYHKHPYMEKAYVDKKWAFVSDYARLDILYQYGGIYLDTDVEVLKDLSPLCELEAFIGFESNECINDGQGFGCVAGMPILREMMECYDGKVPYDYWCGKEHNKESTRLRTNVMLKHGLKPDGTRQTVAGIEVFPTDYFCPLNYATGRKKITDNSYSIHHFVASWHGKNARKYQKLMQRLNRIFGKRVGRQLFVVMMQAKDVFKRIIGR